MTKARDSQPAVPAGEGRMDRRRLMQLLAGLAAVASPPAQAQDPAKISPRSYKVVFENAQIRVLEYRSKPGLGICGQGRHFHPAHVTMQISDAKVRVTLEDGKVITANSPAGRVFASPAEWHTTENIGGELAHAYIIEIKDSAWQPSTG
jgi:beta-alanine degradation protein BauB